MSSNAQIAYVECRSLCKRIFLLLWLLYFFLLSVILITIELALLVLSHIVKSIEVRFRGSWD